MATREDTPTARMEWAGLGWEEGEGGFGRTGRHHQTDLIFCFGYRCVWVWVCVCVRARVYAVCFCAGWSVVVV